MISESRFRLTRIIGAGVLVTAGVLAVLPVLTQCATQLTLASGLAVPMKCHWTAMAAIATAIPLGLVGAATLFSHRLETLRVLAILTAGLGVMAVLLPAALIGVCANPDHLCNIVMRPAMILMGLIAVGGGAALLALTRRETRFVA